MKCYLKSQTGTLNRYYFFQFHYFFKVFEKAKGMSTWTESLYAFVKGPGWFPGTPRLGDPMGVPEVTYLKLYAFLILYFYLSNMKIKQLLMFTFYLLIQTETSSRKV